MGRKHGLDRQNEQGGENPVVLLDFQCPPTVIKCYFTLVGGRYGIYSESYFGEFDDRGQFILSVSQKLELMKGVSESFAGRVSICELSGLSLHEIDQVCFNKHFVPSDTYIKEREDELKSYDNIWDIIHKGTYPELYDIDRDWQEFYSSYVSTYLVSRRMVWHLLKKCAYT